MPQDACAHLAWGLAKLKTRLNVALPDEFIDSLLSSFLVSKAGRDGQFVSSSSQWPKLVSMSAWAFARLLPSSSLSAPGQHREVSWTQLICLCASLSPPPTLSRNSPQSSNEGIKRHYLSVRELSNCLWALATRGQGSASLPLIEAQATLLASVPQIIPHLQKQDISSILWSLGKLNDDTSCRPTMDDGTDLSSMAHLLLPSLRLKAREMEPDQLSRAIWGLSRSIVGSKAKSNQQTDCLSHTCIAAQERGLLVLDAFHPEDLSIFLSSLTRLHKAIDPTLDSSLVQERLLTRLMAESMALLAQSGEKLTSKGAAKALMSYADVLKATSLSSHLIQRPLVHLSEHLCGRMLHSSSLHDLPSSSMALWGLYRIALAFKPKFGVGHEDEELVTEHRRQLDHHLICLATSECHRLTSALSSHPGNDLYDQLDPRTISMLLSALDAAATSSKLWCRLDDETSLTFAQSLSPLFDRLLRHIQAMIRRFKAGELSTSLSCLASLYRYLEPYRSHSEGDNDNPRSEAMCSLFERASDMIMSQHRKPRESPIDKNLGSTRGGLRALMRTTLHRSRQPDVSRPLIHLMTPFQLSKVAWAFAWAGQVDEELFEAIRGRILPLLSRKKQPSQWLEHKVKSSEGLVNDWWASEEEVDQERAVLMPSTSRLLWAFSYSGLIDTRLARTLTSHAKALMPSAEPRDVASLAWSLSLALSQAQGDEDAGMSEGGEALARACLVHASSQLSSYSPTEMARLVSSLSAIEEVHGTLLGVEAKRGHASLIASSSSSMPGRMIDSILSRVSGDILSLSLNTIEDLDLALSAFRALRISDDRILSSAALSALNSLSSSSSSSSLTVIDVSSLVTFLFSLVFISDRASCHHHPLLSSAASYLLPNLDLLTLDELVLTVWTFASSLIPTHSLSSDASQPHIVNLLQSLTLMLRSTLPPPGLLDPSLDLTNREMQLLGQAHSASVIWAESQSVLNQSPCTPPLAIRKEIVTAWLDMEAIRKKNARNRNGLDKTINEVVSVADNLGWILSSSYNPGPAKDGMKKTGALMEEFISDPWLLVFERKDESEGQKMAVLLCDQSSFIASRSGKGMRPNAEHRLKLDMIQVGTGCKTVALSLSQWAGASRAQRDGIITSLTLL